MGSRVAGGDMSWEGRYFWADADITVSDLEDEAEARMAASFSAEAEEVWHPTPVLLPGKPHGQRSLVGCSPWGR